MIVPSPNISVSIAVSCLLLLAIFTGIRGNSKVFLICFFPNYYIQHFLRCFSHLSFFFGNCLFKSRDHFLVGSLDSLSPCFCFSFFPLPPFFLSSLHLPSLPNFLPCLFLLLFLVLCIFWILVLYQMCSCQKFLPSQKFLPTLWTLSSLAVQKLFSFLRCHLWTVGLNSGVNGILFKSPFSTSIFAGCFFYRLQHFSFHLMSLIHLEFIIIHDTGLTLFIYTWTSSTI